MQDPYELHLDYNTIHKIREMHFESHWPSLCRTTVLEYLRQEEPQFYMNGKKFENLDVNPLFNELVNRYYMSFCLDCYDEINIVGAVFFRFVRAPSGDNVPQVIRSEHFGTRYEIFVKDLEGENQYRVVKRKDKKGRYINPKTMKKVMVMDHFGVKPTSKGHIQSKLVGLLSHEIYYQYMIRFSLQAEYTLSNPPIVAETPPEAQGVLPLEERETDYYTPHEYELAKQQGLYKKDQENLKRVQKHQQTDSWQIPLRVGQVTNPVRENVHPIPTGLKIANAPMPQRNTNFVSWERVYELKVCSTYGIPRSLLVQDVSMQTAGAYQLVKDNLKVTLGYWNNICGQVLTAIYRCIYYPEDCNWIVNHFPQKEEMTEKELFKKASRIADVKIVLPIGTHGSLQENYELYMQGVITWEEYVSVARKHNGFGQRKMEEPTEKYLSEKKTEQTYADQKEMKENTEATSD